MNLEEDKIANIYVLIYRDTIEQKWLDKAIKPFKNIKYVDM